jgi:hypothetical protein
MNSSVVFYFGAASLYAAGILCLRHTHPYSRAGGDGYLRRDRRRMLGRILFIAATLCLGMAGMIQYVEHTR